MRQVTPSVSHRVTIHVSQQEPILTFVVFFIPNFTSTGAAPNDVLAEVEGHEITVREFQRRYSAQLQAYRNAYGAQMSEQSDPRSS